MSLRYVAKYRCPDCGTSWKVRNTAGGPKRCGRPHCTSSDRSIPPYEKEAITKTFKYKCDKCGIVKVERSCASDLEKFKQKVLYCSICQGHMPCDSVEDILMRMFGEFACDNCKRKWFSGNAWPGKGQQCFDCKKMIKPTSLKPLKPSHDPMKKEPHKQELCQMCQELGHNCRDEPSEQADSSDAESILSQNSSTVGGDDDDVTPVGSDEEDQDELLELRLESLKLPTP